MPPMTMAHAEDPRATVLREIGDISGFQLYGTQLLLGIYMRPKITAKGIHLADSTVQEDQHQGKAMLILAMGPACFTDGDEHWRGGVEPPAVGDWIAIRPSDGWPININGKLCRMITTGAVRMRIPAPDSIW